MISFVSIGPAGEPRDQVEVRPLFEGSSFSVSLVTWPPNSAPQKCEHDGATECAFILQGSIHDQEDRKVHKAGDGWMRSADNVHYPRSGPDGARLLLYRVTSP